MKDFLKGLRCETCSEQRVFGSPPNSKPDNLYVYLDFSGSTRVFCKNHMSYGKDGSGAILDFDEEHDYPLFGAKLIRSN